MATWDSADLLDRCKAAAQRPTVDTQMEDADWYSYLTAGQHHYYRLFASHIPWVLMGAPTIMSTADSGATYTFSNSITPVAVEIYDTWPNGRLLRPGAPWDANADYIWESSRIRMARGATRTFSSGPYARYISPPSDLDASTEPTLLPNYARELLVYRACGDWARQGGFGDPTPFEDKERKLAWGDPETPGDVGIIGGYKMQNPFYGMAAYGQPGHVGFAYLQQVNGYTAI